MKFVIYLVITYLGWTKAFWRYLNFFSYSALSQIVVYLFRSKNRPKMGRFLQYYVTNWKICNPTWSYQIVHGYLREQSTSQTFCCIFAFLRELITWTFIFVYCTHDWIIDFNKNETLYCYLKNYRNFVKLALWLPNNEWMTKKIYEICIVKANWS